MTGIVRLNILLPLFGRLLFHEFVRAGAAFDAEAFALGSGAVRILELGLNIVAIVVALAGENPSGIFPGGNYARRGQLSRAVLRDLAHDQQVAGLARRAMLSTKVAVLH